MGWQDVLEDLRLWGTNDGPVSRFGSRKSKSKGKGKGKADSGMGEYIVDVAKRAAGVDRKDQAEEEVVRPSKIPKDVWAGFTRQEKVRVAAILSGGTGSDNAFGDLSAAAQGSRQMTEFALDMGLAVDDFAEMWRTTLMRENPSVPESATRNGGLTDIGNRMGPPTRHAGIVTARQYVSRVNTMEPGPGGELEQFQRKLYAAGFYKTVETGGKSVEPMWGAPDEPTLAATRLLSYTTMRLPGKSIVEVLDLFTRAADPDGDGRPGGGADEIDRNTIEVTNPLDVQITAQRQAEELMGRRIPDADARGMAGGFQGQQVAHQSALFAKEEANVGGQVTQAPNMGAFTEQQLRSQHGAEIDAYTYLGAYNRLLQMAGLAG